MGPTFNSPGCSLLFSAATILSVLSLVDAQAPSKLVNVAKIVFACPRVVEVEVGRPKVVDEQSIHVLSCVSVIGTLSLIILRFAKGMRAVKS